jgi:hypothetical protein
MRILSVTSIRLLAVAAMAAPGFVACSGIDGLPDQPVPASDSGESVGDGATTGDAASVVDAGVADAAGDAAVIEDGGEVADGSVVDAAGDASLADATVSSTDGAAADAAYFADVTVDSGPCVPESDAQLCAARAKNCGRLDTIDRCGSARVVATCGTCTGFYETCGGGGVSNVCGCPSESDWAFCWRLGRTCGQVTASDSCGVQRTATCGAACPVDAGVDASTLDAGPADAGAPDASVVQRWTFTNCGASGATGPTQAQCATAYRSTSLDGNVVVADGIQTWTAPESGRYRIVAMGAQGGGATNYAPSAGFGATVQGDFELSAGDAIRIVVGQRGQPGECSDSQNPPFWGGCGGGGGGSFVVRGADALVVAGGGGGTCANASADTRCPCQVDGVAFVRTPQPGCKRYDDRNYSCNAAGLVSAGGCGSYAGCSDSPSGSLGSNAFAGGGGGFATSSSCPSASNPLPWSGQSFAAGARGGGSVACRAGGFGGGGGGGGNAGYNGTQTPTCFNGGGGGGGYSGGSGGYELRSGQDSYRGPGSGGSSFTSGDNPQGFSGYRTGDGVVTIERLR